MELRRCPLVAWVLAAGLCPLTGAVPSAAAAPKNVLILNQGPGVPNAIALRDAVIQALRQEGDEPLNVYEEFIDTIRFPSEEYDRQLAALYRAKYVNAAPALLIALSEPALDFALRHRNTLFPNAALLFGALDERGIRTRNLGPNVTGMFLKVEAQGTLEAAFTLHPGTRHIVVVGGTSRLDRGWLEAIQEDVRAVASRAAVTYITDKPLNGVLAALAALRHDGLVLFVSLTADGNGVARSGPEVLEALRQATTAPIYGMSDNYLGHGIVGGVLLDFKRHGTELGQRARQILSGVQAADLVPMRTPNTLAFDWRELKRFGIDEALLPAGSTVLYRQPGAWELYRPQIIGAGLLVMLQSAFIAALLVQRARRMRIENALHEGQQRYTLATAAGAVGLWDWNLETNQIYVDPTLKSILGFEDAEITNRAEDWGSRVHPEDLAAVTAQAQACIDGVLDEYEAEHRMTHKDGSVRWFLSRGSLLRRADGTPHRMVGTKVDITERKRAEEAIREKEAVLRVSDQEIQNLVGRLIAAQEVERSRIARDLHDDTSQQLAGLAIALSGLKRRVGALQGDGDLQTDVSSLQQRTIALAENVRHLSHALHPSTLEHAGLIAALAGYCTEVQRQQTVEVTFSSEGDFESTDVATALCLYRIAQEALRNVVTHAEARHADVRLLRTGDSVELTIADDGKGFDVVRTREGREGLGLVSINERVRLAGGTVSITTELNKGTRVRVQIPARRHVPIDAGDESGRYATSA